MTLRGHKDKKKDELQQQASASSGDSAATASSSYKSELNNQRHGSTESSGAESWRSTDTARQIPRSSPMKVNTNKKLQYVIIYFTSCYGWCACGGAL